MSQHIIIIYVLCSILKQTALFQRHETVGGGTGSTVSHWSVSDGELTQVVTKHLRSDFYLVEGLTIVHTHHGTNHLWEDNHVSHVSLDGNRLLVLWSSKLGSSQFLHETSWLVAQTTGKSSSDSSRSQLDKLLVGHAQQFLQVDTSVGVGFENSSLAGRCSGGHLARCSDYVEIGAIYKFSTRPEGLLEPMTLYILSSVETLGFCVDCTRCALARLARTARGA